MELNLGKEMKRWIQTVRRTWNGTKYFFGLEVGKINAKNRQAN